MMPPDGEWNKCPDCGKQVGPEDNYAYKDGIGMILNKCLMSRVPEVNMPNWLWET